MKAFKYGEEKRRPLGEKLCYIKPQNLPHFLGQFMRIDVIEFYIQPIFYNRHVEFRLQRSVGIKEDYTEVIEHNLFIYIDINNISPEVRL